MEVFIGQILMFGGSYAPSGFLLCQGQLLPIASFQPLYSVLGNAYGGDGVTTFGVPNLCGRAPVGWGQTPASQILSLGDKGGGEIVAVANAGPHTTNMPFLAVNYIIATEGVYPSRS